VAPDADGDHGAWLGGPGEGAGAMSPLMSLKGRRLLRLADFSTSELTYLLDLAAELKAESQEKLVMRRLVGKRLALIFEKESIRARCAFEVAAYDLGAQVTIIGPSDSHIGDLETVKDTARVLGRIYDAIEYRGSDDRIVEELARWAGVPIYNGLTDEWHPTRVLADFLTLREHVGKPLQETVLCYVGDGRSSLADSYLVGCALLGIELRIASPRSLWPRPQLLEFVQTLGGDAAPPVMITENLESAARGSDAIATSAWVPIGDPIASWSERIALLRRYQIDTWAMGMTRNPDAKFLHSLPAFHTADSLVGEEILDRYGFAELEVTDEVFESPASVVFDQAENRMHTVKAVMVATLTS
jgi:ornithine carbamoyltransferase